MSSPFFVCVYVIWLTKGMSMRNLMWPKQILLSFELRQAITARNLKQTWAAIIIQKHCRGYLVRRLCQLIHVAAVTIQAYTRGFLARKKYRKVQPIKNFISVTGNSSCSVKKMDTVSVIPNTLPFAGLVLISSALLVFFVLPRTLLGLYWVQTIYCDYCSGSHVSAGWIFQCFGISMRCAVLTSVCALTDCYSWCGLS